MTTIAYRNGTLAVDTLGSNGDWVIARKHTKIFRLKDGTVAAACGMLAKAHSVIEWLDNGEPQDAKPNANDDYSIVHLTPKGLFVHESGYKYEIHDDIYALGSGAPAAMAAMYAGASAEEAVRIAMLLDPHTGGDVVTMGLHADDKSDANQHDLFRLVEGRVA